MTIERLDLEVRCREVGKLLKSVMPDGVGYALRARASGRRSSSCSSSSLVEPAAPAALEEAIVTSIRPDVRELFKSQCPHGGWIWFACQMCLSSAFDALEARVRAETWEKAVAAIVGERLKDEFQTPGAATRAAAAKGEK